MLCSGLGLVEALQATIVALIQTPGLHDGHRKVLRFAQRRPRSLDGATKDGGEDDVELETLLLQALPSLNRLELAVLAEVDVVPSCEDVLHIPHTLAVAEEHKLVHHG